MIEIFLSKVSGRDPFLFAASILLDSTILLCLFILVLKVVISGQQSFQRVAPKLISFASSTAGAVVFIAYGVLLRPLILHRLVISIWVILLLALVPILCSGLRKAEKLAIGGVMTLLLGIATAVWFPRAGILTALLAVGGFTAVAEGLVRWSGFLPLKGNNCGADQIGLLVSEARRTIRFTSGTMNPRVYMQLSDVIRKKMEEGVEIECIMGDQAARESLNMARQLSRYRNWSAYMYKGNPVPHAMLVDGHWLRVEDPHSITDPVRWNLDIRNASASAAIFLATFERYKAISELIEPPKNGADLIS
jgi:hypothetical protein